MALWVTSEIYLLEQVPLVGAAMVTSELRRQGFTKQRLVDDLEPVGLAGSMKGGPANESIQGAGVGSIWGFGANMYGPVLDYIEVAE